MYTYANLSNGIAFPHNSVCRFQSNHGHNWKLGYFAVDSMPWDAVIRLLHGEPITIVDATAHNKPLSDGLRYGLTTWAMTFNRAIRRNDCVRVAPWSTREMCLAAYRNHTAKQVVQGIRRLARIYGVHGPVWLSCNDPRCLSTRKPFLGPSTEIRVQCWSKFEADDNPTALATLVKSRPNNCWI